MVIGLVYGLKIINLCYNKLMIWVKPSCGELYFETVMKYEKFPAFKKEYTIGYYRVDFAWPGKKIYLEIDGEQHYTKEGIEHDKKRTSYLSKLGWKCIKRIRWDNFRQLNFKNRTRIIEV